MDSPHGPVALSGGDGDGPPFFAVRIVALDYVVARPIPGVDLAFSPFTGEALTRAPVVRVFGSTPSGQKGACRVTHRAAGLAE